MHGDHTQVCGRVRRTRAEAEGEGGVRATCGMGGSTLNGNVCTHAARGRAADCGTHHALRRTDVFGLEVSLAVASVAHRSSTGGSAIESIDSCSYMEGLSHDFSDLFCDWAPRVEGSQPVSTCLRGTSEA